jgi:hypothetical protein
MKERTICTFALGAATSFALLAGANSIAQQGTSAPKPGITFTADQGGIYDDGNSVYIVKPKSNEFYIIEKGSHRVRGENGEEIPVGYYVKGEMCEPLRSRTWK